MFKKLKKIFTPKICLIIGFLGVVSALVYAYLLHKDRQEMRPALFFANRASDIPVHLYAWEEVDNKHYVVWGSQDTVGKPYLFMVSCDESKAEDWRVKIPFDSYSRFLRLRAKRSHNGYTRVVYHIQTKERSNKLFTFVVDPTGNVKYHRLLATSVYDISPTLCLEQSFNDDWYSFAYTEMKPNSKTIRPSASYARGVVYAGKDSSFCELMSLENKAIESIYGWCGYRGYVAGYDASNPNSTFMACVTNKGKRVVQKEFSDSLDMRFLQKDILLPLMPTIVETNNHVVLLGYDLQRKSQINNVVYVWDRFGLDTTHAFFRWKQHPLSEFANHSIGLAGPAIARLEGGKDTDIKSHTIAIGCIIGQSAFMIDFRDTVQIRDFAVYPKGYLFRYYGKEVFMDLRNIVEESNFFIKDISIEFEEDVFPFKSLIFWMAVIAIVTTLLIWFLEYKYGSVSNITHGVVDTFRAPENRRRLPTRKERIRMQQALERRKLQELTDIKDPGPQEQVLSREQCEVRMMRASLVDLFDLYYDIERLGLVDQLFVRLSGCIQDQTNPDDVRRFYIRLAEEKKPEFVRIVLQHPRCVFGLLAGVLTLIQPDEYQEEILACVKQISPTITEWKILLNNIQHPDLFENLQSICFSQYQDISDRLFFYETLGSKYKGVVKAKCRDLSWDQKYEYWSIYHTVNALNKFFFQLLCDDMTEQEQKDKLLSKEDNPYKIEIIQGKSVKKIEKKEVKEEEIV